MLDIMKLTCIFLMQKNIISIEVGMNNVSALFTEPNFKKGSLDTLHAMNGNG